MKPTDVLSNEHRVIEQVLNCLERMVCTAGASGILDGESAVQAVEFFRMFADKCHHGKEEARLFPLMEARGFSRDNGPTGVMLAEHEMGRHHVGGMAAEIENAARGDAEALHRFSQHAESYIALLREHIQKEDHCLFSMANQVLTPEDQSRLQAEFERVETEEMGEGTHEKYLGIANALADRYGVTKVQITEGAMTCCGHH